MVRQRPIHSRLTDMCEIHVLRRRYALTLLPKFLKGEHLGTKFVKYFTARSELGVFLALVLCWMMDGDMIRGRRYV